MLRLSSARTVMIGIANTKPIALSTVEGCLVGLLQLAYCVWLIAYGFQLYAISYQPYANFARV